MAESRSVVTAQWVLDVSIDRNTHVASCDVCGRLRTIEGKYNSVCFAPFCIVIAIPDRDYDVFVTSRGFSSSITADTLQLASSRDRTTPLQELGKGKGRALDIAPQATT